MDGHRIALHQEITKIISVIFIRNAQCPFMNMIYSMICGSIIKHPHKWTSVVRYISLVVLVRTVGTERPGRNTHNIHLLDSS